MGDGPDKDGVMHDPIVDRIAQFRECVYGFFTYYLEDDVVAVLKHGRPLAVELERADFDTTNLLLFLDAVSYLDGKGVERAKLLWPDLKVSLDRFTIRRAIGEDKRDGEAAPSVPEEIVWWKRLWRWIFSTTVAVYRVTIEAGWSALLEKLSGR